MEINTVPLSILIVDDEEAILKMLITEFGLERPHFQITTTHSAPRALEWIKDPKKHFDIIICDLVMPEIDGLQLAHAILGGSKKARVFLMSGYTSLLDQVKLFELGVEKIIQKPINMDELLNLIDHPIIQNGVSRNEMIGVRITELQKRKINPFDLYLILGKGKIIKVFSANLPIEQERLERYLKNDVKHLYAKRKETLTIPAQFYVPIRLITITENKAIPCDIYYLINDEYRTLLKPGTIVTSAHFEVLKKYKIKKLFIRDRDEPLYEHYLEQHIDTILKAPQATPKEKSEVIFDFVENRLENVFTHPNEENIESMKKAQQTLQSFITETQGGFQEIMILAKEEKGIYAHSIGVASIAYALILEMALILKNQKTASAATKAFGEFSFDSKEVRDIVFLGGLLHDIGKTFLNVNNLAFNEDLKKTSASALETYKTHPQVGYERLKKVRGIPAKTLEIVLQHEELCDGSGFPNGLTKMNISIYTQLITLANHFDHLHREQVKKVRDCLLALKLESAKYNKQLLAVLEKMFTLAKRTTKE